MLFSLVTLYWSNAARAVEIQIERLPSSSSSDAASPLNRDSSNIAKPDDDDAQPSILLKETSVSVDPDAPGPLTFRITPELAFGAKLNLEMRAADDLDLSDSADDHLLQNRPELRLAMLYEPHELIDFYVETELTNETPLSDGTNTRATRTELELHRAYILWHEFLVDPLSLQLGRQRFHDDRQWFFDENLDAVRLRWEKGKFSADAAVAEVLFEPWAFDDNPRRFDEEDVLFVVVTSRYQYDEKERVTFFGIIRDDQRLDSSLAWLGGSWRGRLKRHKIWLDASGLFGDEQGSVRAFGLDGGIVARFDIGWKPSFTLGAAVGSVDFHQTGLQDNEGRFNGVTKFKYYGETVDPELSNLVITTAAFGLLPTNNLSIDLVHHYYSLVAKSDNLRDADIEEELTGHSRNVGHAVDLIFGFKIGEKMRASILGGFFAPGAAFETRDTAFIAKATLQVAF
jgi:alginate production protein